MSTWALVGSPNSGKTTLYNWLTGSRSKTVNYPGSTVEYGMGPLRSQLAEKFNAAELTFVDTPGVYSLTPQSEDELVTHNVLFNTQQRIDKIDGVVVVMDATQLSRHLLLAKQVLESGYPAVFVLTMRDLVEKEGSEISVDVLKKELGPDIVLFDGVMGRGLNELIQTVQQKPSLSENVKLSCPNWSTDQQLITIGWAERLTAKAFVTINFENSVHKLSNKIDSYFLHPLLGFALFFAVMTLLFSSIYWLAAPAMDLIDAQFSALADWTMATVPGLTGEFLGAGLVAGVGGVVIFVPQIFILFIGIGLLESSGYLARVAVLIDKPLSMVGLGGRSFVPLLSGFACAIPAIMATRNISSKKERLIAQSIIPFMTCSARLPVYALLLGFLYGTDHPLAAGFALALLYFGAIVVGAIAANVIAILINDKKSKSRLLMELPLYRRPKFFVILMQALSKSKSFLLKAGPIILVLSAVLWFGTNFPRVETEEGQALSQMEIAQDSYAADVGKVIEPVFKPMGVDWRVGFGLISAFAAREVFVSSMALVFKVEADDENAQMEGLINVMKRASFPNGEPIFTVATVIGLIIFFMIALQCTSTVGILKREAGSWRPALMQLVFSNLVAYCLTVVVVFVLKALGY